METFLASTLQGVCLTSQVSAVESKAWFWQSFLRNFGTFWFYNGFMQGSSYFWRRGENANITEDVERNIWCWKRSPWILYANQALPLLYWICWCISSARDF